MHFGYWSFVLGVNLSEKSCLGALAVAISWNPWRIGSIQANHAGEGTGGNDLRSLVAMEGEQTALVARDEVIGLARFGHG